MDFNMRFEEIFHISNPTSSDEEVLSSDSNDDDQMELDLPHLSAMVDVAKSRTSSNASEFSSGRRRGAICFAGF